jgi:hypothetical protein
MKTLRWIGWVMGTIILGAFGSGLWERVMSPAFSALFSGIAELISRFSKGYQDSIYWTAARSAPSGEARVLVYFIFIGFLFAMFVISSPSARRMLDAIPEHGLAQKSARIVLRVHTLFLTVMLSSTLISMSKAAEASRIESDVLRSTDILRPVIGERLYVQYRADFYAMNDRSDFEALKFKLDAEAKRYGVKIPVDQAD